MRIQSEMGAVVSIDVEEEKKIDALLEQKFFYYGKGSEAYVFESEDKKFVLKFFKQKANPFAERRGSEKSYRLAAAELVEETGLVATHLDRTDSLHNSLCLVDKLNIAHLLDPNAFQFVVQKKAEPVLHTLEKLICKGDVEGTKEKMTQILHLFSTYRSKGICEKDGNISRNFGFYEGEAIQIDLGGFQKASAPSRLKAGEFLRWLEPHPELTAHFKQECEKNDVTCY